MYFIQTFRVVLTALESVIIRSYGPLDPGLGLKMSHAPLFTLPEILAPQVQTRVESAPASVSDEELQRFANAHSLAVDSPYMLVVAAAFNSSILFHLLALGRKGPLAKFTPGEVAGSIPKYDGRLPPFVGEFFRSGMTTGDVIAVLAARGSASNAMHVLMHARRLGVTALGAALVPRAVVLTAAHSEPVLSDALDTLRRLSLPPEYHAVAVGALLRWPKPILEKYAVLQKVAEYMQSCGIDRSPVLAMYAALCRRDGHALVNCRGLPVLADGSTIYGPGDLLGNSDAVKALRMEAYMAIKSRRYLRALAIIERLDMDTRLCISGASSALYRSTTTPLDALALFLALLGRTHTEESIASLLQSALRKTRTVLMINLLVQHSGYPAYLLASALAPPITLTKFHRVSEADLVAARFVASTPADRGATSALAISQGHLFKACDAIASAGDVHAAIAAECFVASPESLFVLLIHAIDRKAKEVFAVILSHDKFRDAPGKTLKMQGLHHAVYRACTHAYRQSGLYVLRDIISACKPFGIAGLISEMLTEVSGYGASSADVEMVGSFLHSEMKRSKTRSEKLAAALKKAVEDHRDMCPMSKLKAFTVAAHACSIDIHKEALESISRMAIFHGYVFCAEIVSVYHMYGEHAGEIARAAYRRAAKFNQRSSGALHAFRNACPRVPLAERMLWDIFLSNWTVVFDDVSIDQAVELFIERCKKPRLEKDWTRHAMETTRLRVSQRKRVVDAYVAQCMRGYLAIGEDYFGEVAPGRLAADDATCPLCFEHIDDKDSIPDPIADHIGTVISQSQQASPMHKALSVFGERLEPEQRWYSLPKIPLTLSEIRPILDKAKADMTPVAVMCPGKHLAHRMCLREWLARRSACPVCSFAFS